MALKFVARAVRLLGFVVSPLVTSPAAAAPPDRGALLAPLRDGASVESRAADPARAEVAPRGDFSRGRC